MGSKTKHKRGHKSDITPPSWKARSAPYNIQRGGGGGTLEASRDRDPGRKASRAAPVPGPTAEQVAREAMAGQETPAALSDQETRAAMADLPPRPRPQPPPWPLRLEPYYPPKENTWGNLQG